MSFPVPGTLMIEPTESEFEGGAGSLLRRHDRDPEGDRRGRGRPLRDRGLAAAARAAHRARHRRRRWARAYSRAEGCFPDGASRTDKYWCPVGRVDNVYGDRNLVCSCPPVADYAQAAE